MNIEYGTSIAFTVISGSNIMSESGKRAKTYKEIAQISEENLRLSVENAAVAYRKLGDAQKMVESFPTCKAVTFPEGDLSGANLVDFFNQLEKWLTSLREVLNGTGEGNNEISSSYIVEGRVAVSQKNRASKNRVR